MTLIEMVRKARAIGHRWVAIDKFGDVYTYPEDKKPTVGTICFSREYGMCGIGTYKLTCDWKDSLIDVTKLRGIR